MKRGRTVEKGTVILFAFWFFVVVFGRVAGEIFVPQSGITAEPHAVEARSPNHWTAREVPGAVIFNRC